MTSKVSEMRARAKRLASSPTRIDDIEQLIRYLRFNSHGNYAVKDLGDMAAHSEERDKGITRSRVCHLMVLAQNTYDYFNNGKPPLDLSCAPENLFDIIEAAIEVSPPSNLTAGTGMSKKQAESAFAKIKKNFSRNSDGSLKLNIENNIKSSHINLIKYSTSVLVAAGAFSEDNLFEQFQKSLLSNKFLTEDDIPLNPVVRAFLALYFIYSINGVKFIGKGNVDCIARSGWGFSQGKSYLFSSADVVVNHKNGATISLELFKSDLDPNDWFENFDGSMLGFFQSPICINNDNKIEYIE